MRLLALLVLAAGLAGAAGPIRPHPANPRYFLFRGKPLAIVSSGEHYGAVLNLDFDFRKYLDTLAREGMTYTRLFTGAYAEVPGDFGIERNDLAPAPGRLLAPWARSSTPGYRYGGNKFDLSRWDGAYFARLKEFFDEASKRGIVVELTLYCATYGDRQWSASPFHSDNNVNSTGLAEWRKLHTLSNGPLLDVQERLVRRLVEVLNGYDNLIFEIQNEPWADRTLPVLIMNPYLQGQARGRWPNTADLADDESLAWQARVASWVESAEKSLPNRHLVAQNLCNFRYPARRPVAGAGSLNFHYAYPEAAIWNRGLDIPIGYDETGFLGPDDALYRAQAWRFMLAGGSLFNHLDYSFSVGREDGTDVQPKSPGGGSPALRRQFLALSREIHSLPFLRMRHDPEVVLQAPGAVSQALSSAGEAYLIYLEGRGPVDLVLALPAGTYKAAWIEPLSGAATPLPPLAHKGGPLKLRTPEFASDIALKIVR